MSDPCADPRRGVFTRRMPAWGGYGPGFWATVIWAPLVSLDPILDVPAHVPAWPAALACLTVLAAFTTAVAAAYRTSRSGTVVAALTVQTVVTFLAAGLYGDHWYALFTLLALAYGAVVPPRLAPRALAVLVVCAAALVLFVAGDAARSWTTALVTFLTGFGTFTFHRLLTVIAELDATRDELARTAVDEERLRFARDLHDLLGHTLSVIVVKAQVTRRLLPERPGAAADHATDIEDIGRHALEEVREAVSGYREADTGRELDRARIALDAAGITLRVHSRPQALPPAVDALFGWVVREGVTNVIRHSGARHCDIGFHTVRDGARVTVDDDGHGGAPGRGAGLRGLTERTAETGGRLHVGRSRRGFHLSVEVPLPT
ncbi:two-component system sensor histidine kinase DesK [Stackebrandtia albiflava]|uniref:Two-component system sensor histidine kinase DesK n=1 Tax=Stackebrandtia albiflava TaxID=406432 RepID=A0A562VAP3_9ACTN|nr:sensor histidine kinase [Stackebrandtia albiflava]TWJ14923.1 two-component system sensor histidine kinase DesK [Stackebrandtia albiflava]